MYVCTVCMYVYVYVCVHVIRFKLCLGSVTPMGSFAIPLPFTTVENFTVTVWFCFVCLIVYSYIGVHGYIRIANTCTCARHLTAM